MSSRRCSILVAAEAPFFSKGTGQGWLQSGRQALLAAGGAVPGAQTPGPTGKHRQISCPGGEALVNGSSGLLPGPEVGGSPGASRRASEGLT